MKCLVTGGAGFIGSHVVEALIQRGDAVRVLDNFSTGRRETIQSFIQKIEFMEGDLRNPADLERAVSGVEVIFHQAALRSVPRSIDDPSATNEVNIDATLSLLLNARRAGVKRVVYASSSSAYGDQKSFPQSETMRCSPLSPYAVSKLAGELYSIVFSRTFGLETVSLRYFNVFGPRQHPESQYAAVIPKFMQCAKLGKPLEVHSDGKQSRDFTYIDNVVRANLLAAEKPKAAGDFFNIANGKNYSLLDIIAVLEKLTGHKLERHHGPARTGDVRKTWADIRKAKRLLGYKPSVGFEEGLKRTWEWFNRS
jgi:UDP-N-acetylglucosamine/UDP-N-acetyl-alpha-D-glucosaminouronate 4-epimerase